jgi:hypothetical protein
MLPVALVVALFAVLVWQGIRETQLWSLHLCVTRCVMWKGCLKGICSPASQCAALCCAVPITVVWWC